MWFTCTGLRTVVVYDKMGRGRGGGGVMVGLFAKQELVCVVCNALLVSAQVACTKEKQSAIPCCT